MIFLKNTQPSLLLERYSASIKSGRANKKKFELVAEKLILLTLFAERSKEKLHRRWQAELAIRLECEILHAAMVINKNDPLANGIRDILKHHSGYTPALLDKKLKELLQIRNNEISEIQSARGKVPKKPSPFKEILNGLADEMPEITLRELIKELKKDSYCRVIRDVDEDAQKVYLENGEEKSFRAVQTTLNRIKNKKNKSTGT
jgi:hypothetical protein